MRKRTQRTRSDGNFRHGNPLSGSAPGSWDCPAVYRCRLLGLLAPFVVFGLFAIDFSGRKRTALISYDEKLRADGIGANWTTGSDEASSPSPNASLSGCRRTELKKSPLGSEVVIPPPPQPRMTFAGAGSSATDPATLRYGPGDRRAGSPANICDIFPERCALSPPERFPCTSCGGDESPPPCPPCPTELGGEIEVRLGDVNNSSGEDGESKEGQKVVLCSFVGNETDGLPVLRPKLDYTNGRINDFRFHSGTKSWRPLEVWRGNSGGASAMPRRPKHCPYVMPLDFTCGKDGTGCTGAEGYAGNATQLLVRDDVLWLHEDRGGHRLKDDGERLPGVSTPPMPNLNRRIMEKSSQMAVHPIASRRHLLSFMGRCTHTGFQGSSRVRSKLHALFVGTSHPGVFFECTRQFDKGKAAKQQQFVNEAMNVTFALIPHGDGRWSYRFTEAILFGTVPVVISDGWEFPFGELVNWEDVVVRIGEADLDTMESVDELLSRLPGVDRRENMHQKVLAVRERFFSSDEAREKGILEAIRRRVACTRP